MAEAFADPAIRRYNGAHDRLGRPAPPLSLVDAEAAIDRGKGGPEAHDARPDDGHVESGRHRKTRRIHIASPSTTSTVTRIISTIVVTRSYRDPWPALSR